MAYCSHCGQQISDQAPACPHCGHPTALAQTRPAYAGFWIRFVALLIDSLILGAVGWAIDERSGIVLGFLYNWLMIGLNDGRTIGKIVMGIRIARPDGSKVDLGTAAARAGMAIVSGIALGIGYLWAAWDDENRTWHDIVADTRAFSQPR